MNVKRLQKELRELHKDPISNCIALPFEENISQWRFIFKGADDTDYRGGLYMGSIVLPEQYSNVITARTRYYVHQFKENIQQAAFALDEYKKNMKTMKSNLINQLKLNCMLIYTAMNYIYRVLIIVYKYYDVFNKRSFYTI